MPAASIHPSFTCREKTVCKARGGGGVDEWLFWEETIPFPCATLHRRDEATRLREGVVPCAMK